MVWGPGDATACLRHSFDAATFRFGGVVLSAVYLSILATTALLGLILFGFFRFSRIGIAMRQLRRTSLLPTAWVSPRQAGASASGRCRPRLRQSQLAPCWPRST